MKLLTILISAFLGMIPQGKAFLDPLQKRDSVLIADQLEYGFELQGVGKGTVLALPDFSAFPEDTLALTSGWKIDTLKTDRKSGAMDIRAYVTIAPFEEGDFQLPPITVLRRTADGQLDTLEFEPVSFQACSMPIDTATFEIHDIKDQIRYPVTFAEVAVYLGIVLGVAVLVGLVIWLLRIRKRRLAASSGIEDSKESAYVVALRRLDRFRGDKFWAPEKQKAYYSGITDALKFYMEDRFGVDAPEMTTAELFSALKGHEEIPQDLLLKVKALFECADFVKFAKHVASEEENASALPVAIQFVMSTYNTGLEEEPEK